MKDYGGPSDPPIVTSKAELDWDVLLHPSYSPDLAPSDCHLFRSLENDLRGKHFESLEHITMSLLQFFFFYQKEQTVFSKEESLIWLKEDVNKKNDQYIIDLKNPPSVYYLRLAWGKRYEMRQYGQRHLWAEDAIISDWQFLYHTFIYVFIFSRVITTGRTDSTAIRGIWWCTHGRQCTSSSPSSIKAPGTSATSTLTYLIPPLYFAFCRTLNLSDSSSAL